jgi:hypothetical protein
MSSLLVHLKRSHLPFLIALFAAALTATSVYAGGKARPLAATDLIGSPDAAVNGKFAVGSASVGTKALTVTGVIDFLGAGTVHNYFTQGGGNNMQINTNVDEANAVGDAARSQWKVVLGSNLDQFSIRRSPAGGTYDEDALFFIDGSTGRVGIATVNTSNGATIPFTPQARLDVETSSGDAVRGISTATTGLASGIYGRSASTSGYGVFGYATATTGTNIAIYGQSFSPSGYGVYGFASATSGFNYGVYGSSASSDGYGGFFANGAGGIAGRFNGNVSINGTLSKTAGSFKIDDPLDPSHKYLQHSFVESPDMMNVYNGNSTLDDNGEAVITLPDWFEALNQDFRYQLTAIGGPGPNLYVADKIQDNKFRIAGGEPGMEVSWLVTGIRHDPYAEAHRIQVVVDKPASEQGTYLFPSLYGQPDSKGLDYAQQAMMNTHNPPEPASP